MAALPNFLIWGLVKSICELQLQGMIFEWLPLMVNLYIDDGSGLVQVAKLQDTCSIFLQSRHLYIYLGQKDLELSATFHTKMTNFIFWVLVRSHNFTKILLTFCILIFQCHTSGAYSGPWQRNFVDARFLQFHMFPTVWSCTTTIGLPEFYIRVCLKVTFTVT